MKERVHLDVFGSGVAELTSIGATVVERFDGWTVMADPEGGEVCLFDRHPLPAYRLYEVVIDCAAAQSNSRGWAGVWGAQVRHDEDHPWWWVEGIVGAPFECVVFVDVTEPKTVKNRIHWNVTADSIDPLLQAGATLLRGRDDKIGWDVLADPEGNEFCVFAS